MHDADVKLRARLRLVCRITYCRITYCRLRRVNGCAHLNQPTLPRVPQADAAPKAPAVAGLHEATQATTAAGVAVAVAEAVALPSVVRVVRVVHVVRVVCVGWDAVAVAGVPARPVRHLASTAVPVHCPRSLPRHPMQNPRS